MNSTYQVSVKGFVWVDGKTLLRGNERGEWELLGGRLEHGEDPVSCVIREFGEESGLTVRVKEIRSPWFYSIGEVRTVLITPFECEATHVPDTLYDQDGGRLHWFTATDLSGLPMPNGYKDTIAGQWPAHSKSIISDEQTAAIRARPKMSLPEFKPIIEFQFLSTEQTILVERVHSRERSSLPECSMDPSVPISTLIEDMLRHRRLTASGPHEFVTVFTTSSDEIRFVYRQRVEEADADGSLTWADPGQFYEG